MNDKAQDELDYLELIAKVATIDKDAASYMQGPMRKLYSFSISGDLREVVVWEDTPQGANFWFKIAIQL